jgi:L-threonylcarbamoyladenylate synthase
MPPSGSEPLPSLPAFALAGLLRQGSAALFPTDTLPALACLPHRAGQLWQLKRRPADKPLILMAADAEQLGPVLGQAWDPAWIAMAGRGWPGALTLVLPATGALVNWLNPGGTSLGLRIPACAQARELLRLTGPLATTSANRSGELAALTAEQAAMAFPEVPLLAPLPWPPPSGFASTVLGWRQGGQWEMLRQGAVLPADLMDP